MFDRVGDKSKSRSVAGPTPYHRQESYFPLRKKLSDQKFRWLIYDNNGSFNGWFDWLPLWMRVGPWSPLFTLSLVSFYTVLFWFRPRPLEFEPSAIINYEKGYEEPYFMGMPKTTLVDLSISLWGLVVIAHAKLTMQSVAAFFISFTGWSWMLITVRAGLEFCAWAIFKKSNHLSTRLATLGSSLRLVTITNATVVCTIWNLILLPIIYFVSMLPGEKRNNFLKFNFGFFMTNIHLLNLPLAYLNILSGERVRLFTLSDLWVSYLVVMSYSIIYFFVMDRFGLHFYPIFCPRSSLTVFSIAFVIGLYYFLFLKWNDFMSPGGVNDSVEAWNVR